jgi:MFS family permease
MVLPFLTLYLTVDRRLPASTAGLAITIYGISAIVIAPLSGRLSDRLGGLRIMKTSLVLSGMVLLIFSFVHSLSGIFAVTAVWAITSEAFRPPSMAIIGELAGPQQRKAAFALTRLAINLGMSIGPVVGGFLAIHSFKLLFYVDGATSLLAGALIAILPWRQFTPQELEKDIVPKTNDDIIPRLRYSDVLRDRLFIYFLLAMIPIELVFFQPLAAMPLFLVRDLHMTEAGFGALLAINTVIIILVEVALNAAMADCAHRYAISLGALLVGTGFGALIFVNSVFAAAATIVIWTFGEMILLPASSAFVSDIAPSKQAGAYMGLYMMGFSVAVAIGPWLGIQILEHYGSDAVWIGTFVCGCMTTAMIWFLPAIGRKDRTSATLRKR